MGKLVRQLAGHGAIPNAVAFRPDGKQLASGGVDGTIHLWDLAADKRRQITGQPEYLYAAEFTPDGRLLATGSNQGIVLWDVSTGKERGRLVPRPRS